MTRKLNLVASICMVAAIFAVATDSLAAPRDTLEQESALCEVRAGETIEAGHLVVLRAPDYLAWKATDTVTNAIVAIGRAEAGAVSNALFHAKPGIYKWKKSGTITESSVGQDATAMNSTTVTIASVSTNDLAVGKIVRVESDGIWVQTDL